MLHVSAEHIAGGTKCCFDSEYKRHGLVQTWLLQA